MLDLIIGLTYVVLGLLLSNVDAIGDREARIITTLGWAIALYFAKEGGCIND